MGGMPGIRYARTDDGVNIAYCVYDGQGAPFLNLPNPGAPPLSVRHRIRSYRGYVEARRGTQPYVEMDCRGYGLSGRFRGEPTLDDWCLDIAAVVRAIGEPVHLSAAVAHCHDAALFAATHPDSVLSLTLERPVLRGRVGIPSFGKLLLEDRSLSLSLLLRSGYELAEDESADALMPEYRAGVPKETVDLVFSSPVLANANLADTLPRVKAPVLIFGHSYQRSEVGEIAALAPNARLVMLTSHPANAALGCTWRAAFDDFWASGRGDAYQARAYTPVPALSARESEVLFFLASGQSNETIAQTLTLSPSTVARHIANIYNKLGVHNRVEAANWAREHGVP